MKDSFSFSNSARDCFTMK